MSGFPPLSSRGHRRILRPLMLILFLFTAMLPLVSCTGIPIGPQPQVNLAPLTPAPLVPLSHLHWCSGSPQTKVQPSFPVSLPPTLSADYCLSHETMSDQAFTLSYNHSYYNNGFMVQVAMFPFRFAQQGIYCQTVFFAILSPQPSEPYPNGCSYNQGALKTQINAPESDEDIIIQLQSLQPNVQFLPQ